MIQCSCSGAATNKVAQDKKNQSNATVKTKDERMNGKLSFSCSGVAVSNYFKK